MLVKMIVIYLIVMNVVGFMQMGIDKRKAKRHAWRIPEKVLFCVAVLGGSVGSLVGMYVFHHKTKHMRFVFGMPLILIVHIILGCVIYF